MLFDNTRLIFELFHDFNKKKTIFEGMIGADVKRREH